MSKQPSPSLALLLSGAHSPDSGKQMDLLQAMMQVQPTSALDGPQLSAIRRADPQVPVQAVARLLGYVAGMFNFAPHKNLNTLQASMLANDIVLRYWQLKFDEVVYVFREGANGRYHTFDRIDPGVIHGWFAEYLKERDDMIEARAHAQAVAYKQQEAQRGPLLASIAQGVRPSTELLVSAESAPAPLDIYRANAKRTLEGHSDEDLHKRLRYFARHPDQDPEGKTAELVTEVLQEREQARQMEAAQLQAKVRRQITDFKRETGEALDYWAAEAGLHEVDTETLVKLKASFSDQPNALRVIDFELGRRVA